MVATAAHVEGLPDEVFNTLMRAGVIGDAGV
jgi:hypothetical protein